MTIAIAVVKPDNTQHFAKSIINQPTLQPQMVRIFHCLSFLLLTTLCSASLTPNSRNSQNNGGFRRPKSRSSSTTSTTTTTAAASQPQKKTPLMRGGAVDTKVIPPGTSAMTPAIFNIVKSIVGAGVLGLPAGIAAFGNHPTALLPAAFLLISIGCMAAMGFVHIGTVCYQTKATSYQEAWSRSVSPRTAWLPTTACTLVTTFAVLCYSMILADTIPSLAKSLVGVSLARTPTLITFTTAVLLPLCLLRTLSKLAPFSLLGILGMVYTCGVMMVRWLSGTYAANGPLATASAFAPKFGNNGWQSVFSSNSAILVSMLSTAYMAHYNAPRFLWELSDRSQFQGTVWISFAVAMLLMLGTAAAGFGTFGGHSQSLILNNYAPTDVWMGCSRAAVTLSLICSFPLAFSGVRDGWMQLLKVSSKYSDGMTVLLLTCITSAALVLKDIRLILAFSGAAFGNLLVYVFPAFMIVGASRKNSELKSKVPIAVATGVLGLAMGIVGTAQAIQSI